MMGCEVVRFGMGDGYAADDFAFNSQGNPHPSVNAF
jgi:hypothetical protein